MIGMEKKNQTLHCKKLVTFYANSENFSFLFSNLFYYTDD